MADYTIAAVEALLARWEQLPAEMEEASLNASNLRQEIANLQMDIANREYTYAFDIQCEQGENGKPKYSNQTARDTAVARLMANDEGVQTRRKQIAELEDQKNRAERLLWKMKEEFQIHKTKIRVWVAVIEGLSDPVVRKVLHGEQSATDKW